VSEVHYDAPMVGDRQAPVVRRALRRVGDVASWLRPSEPLELQIVGRTLMHAAVVGVGAGILGCLFFVGCEQLQHFLLEQLAGYEQLHAHGEQLLSGATGAQPRLWLLALIPMLGGLAAGVVMLFAPECRGGGGDAAIEAFHHSNGVVRRRVLWVKPIASILTLGSGGSGGREGPTMHMGAALGSTVGRYLGVTARERRTLMVAGIAAGISAVFRAPLGAALIAIEMLYRDDFESEALIPAVLASVIAYSISITVFGQSTLFGYLTPHAFRAQHLPLYIMLAVVVASLALLFGVTLRGAQRIAARAPGPIWLRPALGGLALGVFVVLLVHFVGPLIGREDQGVGVLGGGYGAAQAAISGATWLASDWTGVEVLLLLALAKLVATSLTIGSGGSAGDFAPALAIGGLIGGAFGLAARLVLDDPSIPPGAFALVGMAAFYGGLAKTPLASVILVCEMAGSYDLLVPLMLAVGISFVALRRFSLYPAQVRTVHESPVHRLELDPMTRLKCRDVVRRDRTFISIDPSLAVPELALLVERAADQDVFPVIADDGKLLGVISAESLRILTAHPELRSVAIAADLMGPLVAVRLEDDLRTATQLLVAMDLRALPLVSASGEIIAMLDEHDVSIAVLAASAAPHPPR
jgi:CIC family chloride channel protein